MTTLAFNADAETQAKYVSRVESHYDLDEIVKGRYWEGGKGCAVGCAVHVSGGGNVDPHEAFASQLGFPLQIAGLVDSIFEALPDEQAKDWPLAVVTAPKLGADLSQVWPKFAIWLMSDPEYGVENITTDPTIKALCRAVAEGYRTGQTTGPQAEALAERSRAAWDAWDARDARDARAARAAWDARDAFVVASADTLLLLLTDAQ